MDILFLIHQYLPFGLNIKRCNKKTNQWDVSHYNWKKISKFDLSDDFVEEFKNHIIYRHYYDKNQKQTIIYDIVPEKTLDEIPNDYFESIIMYQPLNENFFNETSRNITPQQWGTLWMFQNFTECFLEKNKQNWSDEIWIFQKLSEDFIEKNIDVVNWDAIFRNQKLSENFVLKHIDKVSNLKDVYKDQELSDDFYLKYKWSPLQIHKKTGEKLIRENISILDLKSFFLNKKHNENLIEFVIDNRVLSEEEWDLIWMFQKVSTSFILKYRKHIKNLEYIIWSQDLSIKFVELLLK